MAKLYKNIVISQSLITIKDLVLCLFCISLNIRRFNVAVTSQQHRTPNIKAHIS